jgi:hypothetical protein
MTTTDREALFYARLSTTDPDECWLWTGSRRKVYGYGMFEWEGQSQAHRASYAHFKGPIPPNTQIDHLCSNPPCVNPSHLEAVDLVTDGARKKIRNRWRGWPTHCKAGHLMDDLNTHWRANGTGRQCRTCQRARQNEWALRNGRKAAEGKLGPNHSLKNKHLYDLTAEDYERAQITEHLIEVFWRHDTGAGYGSRYTEAA